VEENLGSQRNKNGNRLRLAVFILYNYINNQIDQLRIQMGPIPINVANQTFYVRETIFGCGLARHPGLWFGAMGGCASAAHLNCGNTLARNREFDPTAQISLLRKLRLANCVARACSDGIDATP
jgi:hypothetical protein